MERNDSREEESLRPLQDGFTLKFPTNWRKTKSWSGPRKVIRLLILGILVPGILISVPIYLRYRVYDAQLYPLGISDMRLIDSKVSTTWCQRQIVKANISFNAFLMPNLPTISKERLPVHMTRHLLLDDDMKEYWGFYLLKGSTVTVSSCSRWPGASLILIRGHRHLHECAYIGDDSSEEEDELREIELEKEKKEKEAEDGQSNRVDLLKRSKPEIAFLDPVAQENANKQVQKGNRKASPETVEDSDITAKEMKELLSQLVSKSEKAKASRATEHIRSPENRKNNDELERISANREIMDRAQMANEREKEIYQSHLSGVNEEKVQTSSEVFDELLHKLRNMGMRGRKILRELQTELIEKVGDQVSTSDIKLAFSGPRGSKVTANKSNGTHDEEFEKLLRRRREIIFRAAFGDDLSQDDEEKNSAMEEGFVPDGHADHHFILNETTLNDKSNSEFWSSFSSSEEALLNCAGLILSLPLTPHRDCDRRKSEDKLNRASYANTITYTVPRTGYYFFVYSSENEVQTNYIRVGFELHKVVYNVTQPMAVCNQTTEQCSLPLDFLSNEKVVLELPLKDKSAPTNEEYVFVSECEPRTAIYLLCVLSVPFFILLFAFQ
uniref:Putative conserved plasma membrane protein n=1 Tax=Lutzomyia longipalpis TaxID=7200 RepID=A0A1B0CLC0_LUTLO